ncbi:hypothetical protein TNCV_779051 [Trichonephila clavipes]|nr:hypothetical protein TNCV_779051 [Trichonephila clavipes]
MHKNKEKDKNAYFKIPNPTHGGQPTNSQTCSESFPKFIVLHATDNRKLSNVSSFLVSKAVQGTQTEISHIETPTNIANLTSESHKDSPIAQKPITNNIIDQETIKSPLETSSTDLESLNQTKHSLTPDTSHLSVPSDAEALMEIDKSSIKRPATDIVQEAAKILKPSIRIESGGIQATKEVEDVKLLSKKENRGEAFHQ